MKILKKVSVTIPVKGKNNIPSLLLCLHSLEKQFFKNFDVILVGDEKDLKDLEFIFQDKQLSLKKIYATTDKNDARNIGFMSSEGEYILYLDHDMRVGRSLLVDCLDLSNKFDAIIIPERGEGGNFWANCRKLEKELIAYDLDTVTPRFFKRGIFKSDEMPFDSKFGLLDEWGFNVKLKTKNVPVGVSNSYLTVSEKDLSLGSEIKNKFLRGLWMKNFYSIDKDEAWRRVDPIKRGLIFYTKNIHYIVKDPTHFIGLLIMKFIDLTFFLLGYTLAIFGFPSSYPSKMIQTYDNCGNLGGKYLNEMYLSGKWNQYVDSSEKQEIIKLWKLDSASNLHNQNLLDLGMGPGRWSRFFLEYDFKSVAGVDISKDMVKFAKSHIKDERFKALLGDMSTLEFPNDSFNKVFSFRSLKYVPNYQEAVKEMVRVLDKKGQLIFEVPNKSLINRFLKFLSFFVISVNQNNKGKTAWGYFSNVNFFSKEELLKLMNRYDGLKLISVTPLFILPSIKLPKIIDEYFTGALIILNKMFFYILPQNIFARSWIVLAEKV